MGRFGRGHSQSVPCPIDIGPFQSQRLAGCPHSAEARQRDNEPPFGIGGHVEHLLNSRSIDEMQPGFVALGSSFQILKRIGVNQPFAEGELEELTSCFDLFAKLLVLWQMSLMHCSMPTSMASSIEI